MVSTIVVLIVMEVLCVRPVVNRPLVFGDEKKHTWNGMIDHLTMMIITHILPIASHPVQQPKALQENSVSRATIITCNQGRRW